MSMLAFGTCSHAQTRRRAVTDACVTEMTSERMETGTGADPSPTVFLIEQEPGSFAPTHFHRQNEFQVFVAGSGGVGPVGIEPITAHSAGAHTGYRPCARPAARGG